MTSRYMASELILQFVAFITVRAFIFVGIFIQTVGFRIAMNPIDMTIQMILSGKGSLTDGTAEGAKQVLMHERWMMNFFTSIELHTLTR